MNGMPQKKRQKVFNMSDAPALMGNLELIHALIQAVKKDKNTRVFLRSLCDTYDSVDAAAASGNKQKPIIVAS